MAYIALKKAKYDGVWRYPGDAVPKADTWKNVGTLVKRGWLAYVADGKKAPPVNVSGSVSEEVAVVIGSKSVKEIRAVAPTWNLETAERMLEEESAGRRRKGAVQIIQDRISELTPPETEVGPASPEGNDAEESEDNESEGDDDNSEAGSDNQED
jgi:hypothetical protein